MPPTRAPIFACAEEPRPLGISRTGVAAIPDFGWRSNLHRPSLPARRARRRRTGDPVRGAGQPWPATAAAARAQACRCPCQCNCREAARAPKSRWRQLRSCHAAGRAGLDQAAPLAPARCLFLGTKFDRSAWRGSRTQTSRFGCRPPPLVAGTAVWRARCSRRVSASPQLG